MLVRNRVLTVPKLLGSRALNTPPKMSQEGDKEGNVSGGKPYNSPVSLSPLSGELKVFPRLCVSP